MTKKNIHYQIFLPKQPHNNDVERAVLPVIMYASKKSGIAESKAIVIGWWKWGIGLIRTTVEVKDEQ